LHVGDKIAMEAFDVSFDRVMSFRGSNAFVLTGEGVGVAPLHELHRRIGAELAVFGYSLKGSFKPHVTMLYDRRMAPTTKLSHPIGWRVKELVLVLSHQGLTRHDYLA